MSEQPARIAEVTDSFVTVAEGRCGICRMLLWLGDTEAPVAVLRPSAPAPTAP